MPAIVTRTPAATAAPALCPRKSWRAQARSWAGSALAFSGVNRLWQKQYVKAFFNGGAGQYWGRFASSEEARRFAPQDARSTYDDAELVDLNVDLFMETALFDWPVLFHLQKHLSEKGLDVLTDFGGHVGVKYYAFREHLALPASFAWQVVDMPAMVRAGRLRAAAAGADHLTFFEHIAEAKPAGVLLCSGVLQYLDGTLEQILNEMPQPPELIILNKVPMCERGGFFTLENFQKSRLPLQIFGTAPHEAMREKLGYRLLTRWHIPDRDFRIPFGDPRDLIKLFGEVWTRSSA